MEVGVVIGRFQVDDLHEGHRFLINTALNNHRKVVVFVGIPARPASKNNPLDYATRERMIRAAFPDVMVMPLLDKATDIEWSEQVDGLVEVVTNKTGSAILYGGRDSFVPHYKGKFKAIEIDSGIEGKSGTTLRREIGRVVRSSSDFRAGQIYFAQNAPIRPICGVDIALVRNEEGKPTILLGRKSWDEPDTWRLPGGKMDPIDETLEHAAQRELIEETNVAVTVDSLTYLSSAKVSDWRDHGHKDLTYFSSLFLSVLPEDQVINVSANDDLIELKWFPLGIAADFAVPKHDNFIRRVQQEINWRKLTRKVDEESSS
jgi:bifunctional NMN adenylyltransferase/nudix hydrolase